MGKLKPNLYIAPEPAPFRGKKGKFIGCCPKCELVLASWEFTDKTKKRVKCTRCEAAFAVGKLKEYVSKNDGFESFES